MRFSVLLISIIMVSCSSEIEKPVAPENLIPRDTMVLIMHDLVIIEGHIDGKFQSVQNYHALARKSGNLILEKFHVDSSRFERSYSYYVGRQDELQSIYSEVLDTLNREVNELKAKGIKSDGSGENSSVLQPFQR